MTIAILQESILREMTQNLLDVSWLSVHTVDFGTTRTKRVRSV